MININLLPHHMRPIKRSPIPYMASFLVLLIALVYVANTFLATRAKLNDTRESVAKATEALAGMQHIVDEANQLERDKQGLAARVNTIAEIMSDRIIWSRQLHNLSRLIPENFWYKSIKVETKKETETREVKDAEGKVTKKDFPVTRRYLTVVGHVAEDSTGEINVNPLTWATTEDPEFASMFSLQPSPFKNNDRFENHTVGTFEFRYLIQPGGSDASEKEGAAS